jgi:hypothetical protein
MMDADMCRRLALCLSAALAFVASLPERVYPAPAKPGSGEARWVLGGFRDVAILAFTSDPEITENAPPAAAFVCGTRGASLVLRTTAKASRDVITMFISKGSITVRVTGQVSLAQSQWKPTNALLKADLHLKQLGAILQEPGDLHVRAAPMHFSIQYTGLDAETTRFFALCQSLKTRGDEIRSP